jgi:hypothetical protein
VACQRGQGDPRHGLFACSPGCPSGCPTFCFRTGSAWPMNSWAVADPSASHRP